MEEKEHLLWNYREGEPWGKGKHACRDRGRWWLEQRDDLVKIFTKFVTYWRVIPKSSVLVASIVSQAMPRKYMLFQQAY